MRKALCGNSILLARGVRVLLQQCRAGHPHEKLFSIIQRTTYTFHWTSTPLTNSQLRMVSTACTRSCPNATRTTAVLCRALSRHPATGRPIRQRNVEYAKKCGYSQKESRGPEDSASDDINAQCQEEVKAAFSEVELDEKNTGL